MSAFWALLAVVNAAFAAHSITEGSYILATFNAVAAIYFLAIAIKEA